MAGQDQFESVETILEQYIPEDKLEQVTSVLYGERLK